MSTIFQCGDNAALIGYVYDECEPAERDAIAAHLTICAACAAEIAALASTRVQITSWLPPDADLGFAVVRPQAPDPRPRAWFSRPLPVWAQLAAAAAIFAIGLALGIARSSILTVGDGAVRQAPASSAAAAVGATTSAAPADSVTAATLEALERRLRDEIAEARGSAPARAGAPADGELLARVRTLIDQSEQRQQRELALRTAQIVREFDSQRRVDLEQIQRSFGQIEGLAGAEVREQRQMLNYLMRVSQER